MTSYNSAVLDLLEQTPELGEDTHAVAERVGCSTDTARRYIQAWESTRHITWVGDRQCDTGKCEKCTHLTECRLLDALELPVLCERVTQADTVVAQLQGTLEALLAARELDLDPEWLDEQ